MDLLRNTGLALSLATGLFPALLGAQGQNPGILPADPILTLHIDGPAALRAAFLPTNVGKMFAGPEFKDMFAPVMEMLDQVKAQAGGQLPFKPEDLHQAVMNYRGRLSIGIYVHGDKIDFNTPRPENFSIVVTLSPDGKTDLAGFCAKAQGMAKDQDRLKEVEVSGKTLSVLRNDDARAPIISTPFLCKDHAVILISDDLKKIGGSLFHEDAKVHVMDAKPAAANIGMTLHTKRIWKLVTAGAKDGLGDRWVSVGVPILKHLGLLSLDSFTVSARTKGPAVITDQVFQFNQGDRGMLGAFFPNQATKGTLVDILPRSAAGASTSHFDIKRIYSGVKAIFADMGDNAPMTFADLEEKFKQEFGLRLFEDLIGLFGTEAMTAQPAGSGVDDSGMLGSFDGMTFGFQVTDGAKLAKSIDTMLRKGGLHAGRKKSDYKGFMVYDLMAAGVVEVQYSVSDNLFLLGIGKRSGDAIRATLDETKNRADGKEVAPLPSEIQARLAMTGKGYVGLGWADMKTQLESASSQFDAMAGDLPPEFDMFPDLIAKFPAMMKTYKLQYIVTVQRSEGSRWVYETIW